MQKYLITSAIPYVNGVKHLGNLIGSMLPADVYARYRRQQGQLDGSQTLFICGTDDHGTPVEIAAQKEKTPVADFVKYWHDFQEEIYTRFGLSFDHFGSSSSQQNRVLTQHFAKKLLDAGLIDVRSQTMLFSKADDRFLPDRYVEGTCPKCGYGKARGDQCDNCGSVLDPTDLIEPYSSISGSKELELRETKHLYLKQSQLVPQLRTWIDAQSSWPHLSKAIAYKWLDEGLEDRGITRDIKWGVPVPPEIFGEDFAGKVFYVWFDAPIAYIAATKEWADKQGLTDDAWKQDWWFGNPDVHYTEFMGKDNVYFHTLSFPATLIGSGEPWKKVDSLKSFNWLTYYGGKFSTSMGVGIFTDTALELLADIPNGADYWRYYLLARAPESDDSAFTWPEFQSVVNKDLADVLGNFVNRTLQLTHKHFGTSIPQFTTPTEADMKLAERLNDILSRYTTHMENSEIRKSIEALRELWVAGNEYLASQEPWQVVKTDKERAGNILNIAINTIVLYARCMAPIAPFSAARIMELFPEVTAPVSAVPLKAGLPATLHAPWAWPTSLKALQQTMPTLTTFNLPAGILFPKITDEQVAEWEARFGNQKI